MLELTVNSGTELWIGDDVKIFFRGSNAPGRMKIGVDAPKEKRIERVAPETPVVKQTEPQIVIVKKRKQ
ncbi:MAG: carbon storage regulator [Ruminococcus flavefaciens]|nr:carbon storage regulator [Roseburia sp.]MCM1231467.1 carbon storage regulator [Ruminococcus flavefaciens]